MLGNEEFAKGHYSECIKQHTAAAKLLLTKLSSQRTKLDSAVIELGAVRDEREFLQTKCETLTSAMSELEQSLDQKGVVSYKIVSFEAY